MQYGYFDDKNKEYVITKADTPRPWSNYLGSTEYGAIITNHAGGYSFYRSAARGRYIRLRFNSVPLDQPGRYFYLRDNDSGDYWSSSWQPVSKDLKKFGYECRHGTAYSVIKSRYRGTTTESTYFVPLGRAFECWILKVKNTAKTEKNISVFTYVEYASDWNARLDLMDLQYSQYVVKSEFIDSMLNTSYLRYLGSDLKNVATPDMGRNSWFTIVGADIVGFDTRREVFIGNYRTYSNPEVVEKGQCTNSLCHGDNACGTMQVNLKLAPGETREFMVLMGMGSVTQWGKKIRDEFSSVDIAKAELQKVKDYWHSRIGCFTVNTPDKEFDSFINVWAAYNSLITYAWSRAASLVYQGERDGLGYRDTVQDILGSVSMISQEAVKRLEIMITGQVSSGGAISVIDPFTHQPGTLSEPEHYRSDDCLWLFNTVPEYVKETGDFSFYSKVLPFADKGEATVLGHLRKALEFNLARTGSHGLPVALGADWNDCIGLGSSGESVFVAFQVRYGLSVYVDICIRLNLPEEKVWAEKQLSLLDENIQKHTWDGEWFKRGYRPDFAIGSRERKEGSIFFEHQPWAIISNSATKEQAYSTMDSVYKHLSTEHGIMLCSPPYRYDSSCGAVLYNAGQKENAGIFCHPQGWAVIAESMLGRGNRAYEFFKNYMPSAYNSKAEVRESEPYVYCQSAHGKYSKMFGKSRLPWLSGTASWSYYAATHYICGICPEYDGLKIDPCLPSAWKELSVERIFRGKKFKIEIDNSAGVEKGVSSMMVNGQPIEGNLIPVAKFKDVNRVTVVMG